MAVRFKQRLQFLLTYICESMALRRSEHYYEEGHLRNLQRFYTPLIS